MDRSRPCACCGIRYSGARLVLNLLRWSGEGGWRHLCAGCRAVAVRHALGPGPYDVLPGQIARIEMEADSWAG